MLHRTPRLVRRLVFGFVLATLAVTAEERRLITEQDLFSFVWVADPQLSPDGTEIAFVRVTVD